MPRTLLCMGKTLEEWERADNNPGSMKGTVLERFRSGDGAVQASRETLTVWSWSDVPERLMPVRMGNRLWLDATLPQCACLAWVTVTWCWRH